MILLPLANYWQTVSDRIGRALPSLRKVAIQFSYMSLGSAIFFLIKVCWVYVAEGAGMAAWLSYLLINVALTAFGWGYHSKVTFKSAPTAKTALRYVNASIGLKLFDYCGFIILTYAADLTPVLAAIIMSALQVAVRFIAYSRYVFHEGETKVGGNFCVSNVLFVSALLVGAINYALAIDDSPPQKDGKQNYCAAANIYAFGVFGNCNDEHLSDQEPQPSMKREPGLPALLAPSFILADSVHDARECAATRTQWCRILRTYQRALLFIQFLALIALVYFAGKDISSSPTIASVSALCAAFGTGLIESSVDFLGEPLAALLLLLVAWMTYRMVSRPGPIVAGFVCGVALGLAVLTKAVYFYLIPVLALTALLLFPFRSWRATAKNGLIAVVIAALVTGLWIFRNHQTFSSNAIAERDGNVMAIRAQLTTMTWRQYWAGYLAVTPKLGPKLAPLLGVDPDDLAMFDRDNPAGFLQRYRRGEGPVSLPKGGDQREMRRQALVAFVENWPMEVALIPLTIYQSAFLPVGSSSPRLAQESGPLRAVRLVSLVLAAIIALGMIPALLLNVVVDLLRMNVSRFAFHLPAVYSVGVHSVMTHYIPRYNLPLFGVLAIELCVAAHFVWVALAGTSARK